MKARSGKSLVGNVTPNRSVLCDTIEAVFVHKAYKLESALKRQSSHVSLQRSRRYSLVSVSAVASGTEDGGCAVADLPLPPPLAPRRPLGVDSPGDVDGAAPLVPLTPELLARDDALERA